MNYFPTHLQGQEQIDKYYKLLASFHHPDREGGNEKTMQEINKQYAILKANNYQHSTAEQSKKFTNLKITYNNNEYDLNTNEGIKQFLGRTLSDELIKIFLNH